MESIKQEKSNLLGINPLSKHMSTPLAMGGTPIYKHEEGHSEGRFGNVAGAASNSQRLKDAKQFVEGSTPKQKLKIGAAGRAVYENATPKKGSGTTGFEKSKNAFKTVAKGSKPASVSSRFSGDAVQQMEDKAFAFRKPKDTGRTIQGGSNSQLYDKSATSFDHYARDKKGGVKTDYAGKPVEGRARKAFSEMAFKRQNQ